MHMTFELKKKDIYKEKFYNKERQLKFSYTWMTSLQIIDLFWRTIYERNYKYNV